MSRQYFISFRGFDSDNMEISYGSLVRNDDMDDIDVFKKDPFGYALTHAKKHNKNVVTVHVTALNEIWSCNE